MKADATAAGQFGFDLIAGQLRGIVANLVDLVSAWSLDVAWVERAGDGSDEDVTVLALRAAEVEMREAEDDAVAGIAKAGAATVEGFHVGANFYEAEGDCRADEGIAAPVHADEWVDVASVILSGFDGGLLRSGSLACKGRG